MDFPENNKNFLEHLEDLRLLIFRIIFVLALFLPVTFYFTNDLISFLVKYSCPPDFTLKYFSPMEPLFVQIKVSLLAAFAVALPYIAYKIWRFIVPALYPHERLRVKQLAFFSWLLFVAGILFCFTAIIPAMMRFSLSMQTSELTPAIGISNFTTLICMMMLGFGIMFQLPIIVLFLTLSGIIRLDTLKKLRPIVLVVILVLSALLTPPDILSQLMMGLPTYLLFELSLFISSVALRSKKNTDVKKPLETSAVPKKVYAESEDFFSSVEESESEDEGYSEDYKPRKTKRKMRYVSRR